MAIVTVDSSGLADMASKKVEGPVVAAVEETVSTAPEPTENKEPQKERKKNSVQDRIDELTREKKELDEFAQTEYESRLQAQRRVKELEEQLKAKEPVKVEENVRPDRSKYTDPDKYENDLLEWNRKEAIKEVRLEQERMAAEQERARSEALLRERVEQARKDFEDFDDVIRRRERSQVAVPMHIQAAIIESEQGAYLAYRLAKDPELERRIYALKPAKALLELGKLERESEAKATEPEAPKTKPPETSRAPAPLSSLKADAGIIPVDTSGPMDFKSYKRQRLQEMRRR